MKNSESLSQPQEKTVNSEINNREFGMSDLKVILFGGKRWMLTAGLLASVAMFMNWGFLVSIGAASLILALAPCLVMCGLGLCMNKSGCKKNESTGNTDQ